VNLILETIPNELRAYDQWVVWRRIHHRGKPQKVPYNPLTRHRASSIDPGTWVTFDKAASVVRAYDGVGFVLSEHDPFVGGDLDRCYHPRTGSLEPWARLIIDELCTYSEISPSGKGIRLFARGRLPTGWRKRGHVEVYDRARFLTVTGQHLIGTPRVIGERSEEIAKCHARLSPAPTTPHVRRAAFVGGDDDELLRRALASRDGDAFWRLWQGDLSGHGGDQSRADLALCNRLAFWTGGDVARIDRLFRRSALFRPKWDQRHFANGRTYGQATVAKAVAGFLDQGTGRRSSRRPWGRWLL